MELTRQQLEDMFNDAAIDYWCSLGNEKPEGRFTLLRGKPLSEYTDDQIFAAIGEIRDRTREEVRFHIAGEKMLLAVQALRD